MDDKIDEQATERGGLLAEGAQSSERHGQGDRVDGKLVGSTSELNEVQDDFKGVIEVNSSGGES